MTRPLKQKPTPCLTHWLCGAASVIYSLPSFAVLTDSLTIGNARAISLGHAVTADPPGIDSIHFNPAGLTRLEGRQAHLKVVGGTFSVDMEFGDYDPETAATLQGYQDQGYYDDSAFYNDAHNSTSTTEGPALMLPLVGFVDLPVLLAPLGGASYSPPDSNATFATNVYSPMMVGFYRADDDPGRWIGQRMSFTQITYFSPSFGYKVSDEFSFGAALTFNYGGVGFELPFRGGNTDIYALGEFQQTFLDCDNLDPNNPGPLAPLCGPAFTPYEELGYLALEVENYMALGFNAGILWEPADWLTFGVSYIAPIPVNMEGDFSWTSSNSWSGYLGPLAVSNLFGSLDGIVSALGYSLPLGEEVVTGEVELKMEMPEQWMFGTSIQVTSALKVNLDYKYAGWSSWQEIPLQFSVPIDFLRLAEFVGESTRDSLVFPLGLEDTWNWAVGVEYQWSDNLVLRCGVEDRPTSLPEGGYTPLLPMGSGKLYGAGFGMKLKDGAVIDLGLMYFKNSLDMPSGTSPLGNDTDPLNFIYNPFFGTDIKTELTVQLIELSYSKKF
jgi:long-subunit fatty acid transport protein